MSNNVLKIGIFYDGNYLYHVSHYFAFHHPVRARISISGLNAFIRTKVSELENMPLHLCQVVDAHYFRGRYTTPVIEQKGWMRGERIFEDVLMFNGITTHYWPIKDGCEKSVDVALALEAFEQTMLKKFDVCVLIAGDGDYCPLVRKLNTTSARVMVLGWDFEFTDERNNKRETRYARALMADASYPIDMSEIINSDLLQQHTPNLFVKKPDADDVKPQVVVPNDEELDPNGDATHAYSFGHIVLLNQGWGFIAPNDDGIDIFFCYADLENRTFDQLRHEDHVRFTIGSNEKGPIAKQVCVINA